MVSGGIELGEKRSVSNSLILDKECLETARKQFCLDVGLPWEEYCAKRERRVFICKNKTDMNAGDSDSKADKSKGEDMLRQSGARIYAGRSSFFWAIICLGQLFICCDEKIYDWVVKQYAQYPPEWFCSFQNLRKLEEKLKEFGHEIQDTHVFFLPEEVEESLQRKESLNYVWFEQEEILQFKENNRFASAICFWEGTPDVLAVAALRESAEKCGDTKSFDHSQMAGMAGVSGDGKYLWQIGINVDKGHAGQGLGHKLVRTLKEEILRRGKVPFYGTSESHTVSQNVGLKAGFVPAWTEVWVRELKGNS